MLGAASIHSVRVGSWSAIAARGSSAESATNHRVAAFSSAGAEEAGAWTEQPHFGAASSSFAESLVATREFEAFPAGVQQQGPSFPVAGQTSGIAAPERAGAAATGVPGAGRASLQAAA